MYVLTDERWYNTLDTNTNKWDRKNTGGLFCGHPPSLPPWFMVQLTLFCGNGGTARTVIPILAVIWFEQFSESHISQRYQKETTRVLLGQQNANNHTKLWPLTKEQSRNKTQENRSPIYTMHWLARPHRFLPQHKRNSFIYIGEEYKKYKLYMFPVQRQCPVSIGIFPFSCRTCSNMLTQVSFSHSWVSLQWVHKLRKCKVGT